MPLTREERVALLAKARAAKAAKFDKALEEANKPVAPIEVVVPAPTEAPTVTTVTPSHEKSDEITLETMDSRFLEVCIADICWYGKEITITNEQHQRLIAKGNPDFTYKDLVGEVIRVLKEGGYSFNYKGLGI